MHKITINTDYCDGCGLCIAFCKKHNLRISESLTSRATHPVETVPDGECNGCRACVLMCPSVAITLTRETAAKEPEEGANDE